MRYQMETLSSMVGSPYKEWIVYSTPKWLKAIKANIKYS